MTLDARGVPAAGTTEPETAGFLLVAGWAVSCCAAGLVILLDVHGGVRPPVVLVGLVGGPGWALCCFLRVRDRALVWALAIAVGLALNVLLGLLMVAVDYWHPVGASVVVLFVSGAVLAVRAVAVAPHPHGPAQP